MRKRGLSSNGEREKNIEGSRSWDMSLEQIEAPSTSVKSPHLTPCSSHSPYSELLDDDYYLQNMTHRDGTSQERELAYARNMDVFQEQHWMTYPDIFQHTGPMNSSPASCPGFFGLPAAQDYDETPWLLQLSPIPDPENRFLDQISTWPLTDCVPDW
ncbi:hypothetical protein FQN54_009386 [Arachnomyces sp. PD_36]|nr:hypothetical protein FQN54_009386 [Arachnomyces sp. PD_36]